ncbi:MAG: FGGY family carbohydrate kinase, partial [Gemmatimonadaceae bacterium]
MAAASVDPDRIAAIGLTNQRETTVVWEAATGRAIANAIVWQDRRTAGRCRKLREAEPRVRATTGLVIDPYFSATKISWLLDHT